MRYACYTSMGHGNSFQREFFFYAGSATHPSSQFGLCLSASPSLWHYRANATYDADFAFPPWSSLLRWVLNTCDDSVFCTTDSDQAVHCASFTVLAFAINVHSAQFPPSALWSGYPIPSSARLIPSSARLIPCSATLSERLDSLR